MLASTERKGGSSELADQSETKDGKTLQELPPESSGAESNAQPGMKDRMFSFFGRLSAFPTDVVGSIDSALAVFDPVFDKVDNVVEKPLPKGTDEEIQQEGTDPTRKIDRAIRDMGQGLDSALGKVPVPHVPLANQNRAQDDEANLKDHIAAVEKKLDAKHFKVPQDIIGRFLICYGLDRKLALDASIAWCTWRNEFGADEIDIGEPDVKKLLHSGAFVWRGHDHEGRPILYVEGTKANPEAGELSPEMKSLIFLLEVALDNPFYEEDAKRLGIKNDPGNSILNYDASKEEASTFTLVYDYSQYLQQNSPGHYRRRPFTGNIKLMASLYNVLIRYYPGRLGMILVCPSNEEVRRQWLEMVEDLSDICGEANTKLLFPDPSEMRAFVPRKWLPSHLGGQSPQVLQPDDSHTSNIGEMLKEAEERAARTVSENSEDQVLQSMESPKTPGVIESHQMVVAQDAPVEEEAHSEEKSETPGVDSDLETPRKDSSPASRTSPVVRPKKAEPSEKPVGAQDRVEDL